MGLNNSKIYLDSCIVIYFLEEHHRFGKAVRRAFELKLGQQFCISPLVELECLTVPLRIKNINLIKHYENFFKHQIILEINHAIFHLAAELRAQHRLKTPDALHLATAQYYNCTEFWTNDNRLNQAAGKMAVNVFAVTE